MTISESFNLLLTGFWIYVCTWRHLQMGVSAWHAIMDRSHGNAMNVSDATISVTTASKFLITQCHITALSTGTAHSSTFPIIGKHMSHWLNSCRRQMNIDFCLSEAMKCNMAGIKQAL